MQEEGNCGENKKMTADSQKDIESLKTIGRICAEALRVMQAHVRAGMTTRELDEIGRAFLEAEGARSAPQVMYQFPGATCISVSPVIAHGIPDEYVLREGELIHSILMSLPNSMVIMPIRVRRWSFQKANAILLNCSKPPKPR